jgi:hypothetical protein
MKPAAANNAALLPPCLPGFLKSFSGGMAAGGSSSGRSPSLIHSRADR